LEKQQVYPILFVTDAQPLSPTYEAKITAQFHEKGLQIADQHVPCLFS
jgi:hypothetical protein